jgi:glycosyltransferase involved in cell wall biosynthesis
MGQTPPPWHGQAVATQILFDHDWPDFEVHRLRMEFSEEMLEVGRFQWKKIGHLFHLIREARRILKSRPECILLYPAASAKWIPFLRDVIFLAAVRPLAGSTVLIFHASGLPLFVMSGWLRKFLGRLAYHEADVALEVAQEAVSPHDVFASKTWKWCPCAIDVPKLSRRPSNEGDPFVVLFVGSLQEGKGVLELLKTASLLKESGLGNDFRFRIVGKWFSEDFEMQFRHMQAELDIEDMVEFSGQLTGNEKWQAYAEADLFFFPTHYSSEATPIVLMEALGAGLRILSTQWAGIPAMLSGCATATLLPICSPDQYANALKTLRTHRHEQENVSEISRAFYHQHFLPARFIERVAQAFVSALGASETSSAMLGDSCESAIQLSSTQSIGDALDQHSAEESPAESPNRPEDHDKVATPHPEIRIRAYLADQNPGYDRSFGISRMTQVVLDAINSKGKVEIEAMVSRTSQKAPTGVNRIRTLPWGTRGKWIRLITDHIHPLLATSGRSHDVYYYPKGYLPLLSLFCHPSVVTIHDTIIQYDEDHYPKWRSTWEYSYWALMLKHTLRNADAILTVSESSRKQIMAFMIRHKIPEKEIHVTFEPCLYERIPQPLDPPKENIVIHLVSCEPHKRSAHLIRWWSEAEHLGREMPMLHLIGTVPPEVEALLSTSHRIVKRPFLEDSALQIAYRSARALILPSEIEGFGLPALEAYYLGTPVCFVKGTSVEEILGVATTKGGFSLDSSESLFSALDEVMSLQPSEIRDCGMRLRDFYAVEKVAARMVEVFQEVKSVASEFVP